ncbi:MAG: hypothetical protein LBT16_07805 [Treponema sp.]|jgi:hypothetical protein|nr:hypothetical protein [Treponema sp.]
MNPLHASVRRIQDAGKRDATLLEHELLHAVIDDEGGMIPELSSPSGNGRINAHLIPWFRPISGETFDEAKHGSFWVNKIHFHFAGNFPCFPNFGAGGLVDGAELPFHGWSANLNWHFVKSGTDEESGAAWACTEMKSQNPAMPLDMLKIDAIIPKHAVHYSSITVKNNGTKDIAINPGFHNLLGAPFLMPGCKVSFAADRWATQPNQESSSSDECSQLRQGTEFDSLEKAPLASGGHTDISLVPPPIGYSDFVVGAIPDSLSLGWSVVTNPLIKKAYICFFPGQAAAVEDDIVLRFNCFLMEYGGRHYTPYAARRGGTDLTYCIGTENVLGSFVDGIEESRRAGKLLGAPTTVTIPAHGRKTLRYGTLFASYDNSILNMGIKSIQAEESDIVVLGSGNSYVSFKADPGFVILKRIMAEM